MRDYLIRRLLLIIVTLFMVSIIVFLMIRLVPGNIVDTIILEQQRRGAAGAFGVSFQVKTELLEEALGLNVPWHIQYGRWIHDLFLHGSLGVSLDNGQPVTEQIGSRMGVTFELGVLGILIGVLIALPIGVYSATRQDNIADYTGRSIAVLFISLPGFWVATLILLYPAIWWGWSPSFELISFREDPLGNLVQFIIPSFILGMALAGTVMRMTRSMVLEVLRQDYIRTAWSKGLKERVVVIRHVLRNSLIPVVTLIGAELPVLVGGAVILEQVFALPGMGRLLIQSLQRRDYTMVSGINLAFAIAVVTANLFVDTS